MTHSRSINQHEPPRSEDLPQIKVATVVEVFNQMQSESGASRADVMSIKADMREALAITKVELTADINAVKHEVALFRNDFEWFQKMALRVGIGGIAVFAGGIGMIGYLLQQLIIK